MRKKGFCIKTLVLLDTAAPIEIGQELSKTSNVLFMLQFSCRSRTKKRTITFNYDELYF